MSLAITGRAPSERCRQFDTRCDVVYVFSQILWHMILVAAKPDPTGHLVLILVDLGPKQGFRHKSWHINGKPAFVLAVNDLASIHAAGIDEPVPDQSNALIGRRKELMDFLRREVLSIAWALGMGES